MIEMTHIKGAEKGSIKLYALSTCIWCKKTKQLLDRIHVAYDFVYVDLLEGEKKDEVMAEVRKWNPRGSFPTLVINNHCIVGFKEDDIREKLGE